MLFFTHIVFAALCQDIKACIILLFQPCLACKGPLSKVYGLIPLDALTLETNLEQHNMRTAIIYSFRLSSDGTIFFESLLPFLPSWSLKNGCRA